MEASADAITQPPAPPAVELAPVAVHQRIEALDVVRGFALLGIFLMNIEWFNRPFAELGDGIPRTATGLDWLATFFVNYFVQGKFWTIFSLLFGMGFAVMLLRAERNGRGGRGFLKVYLRRILALAVFGACHFIFLWEGDILFSYAVAAGALLIVLYGKPIPILLGCAALVGLGFIPDMGRVFGIAGSLAVLGLLALYLRSEKGIHLGGRFIPWFSMLLLLIGVGLSIAATVFWLLPNGPIEPRWPLTLFGPLILIMSWLSWKYHEPVGKRSVRMAVSVYLFAAVAMFAFALVQQFAPDPAAPVVGAATAATAAATPAPAASASLAAKTAAKTEKAKTREERAAEMRAERAKRLEEGKVEKAQELKIFTTGGYWDAVDYRARQFIAKAADDTGFAVVLLGMFLLGNWFVRSGVMEHTEAHLPFFRKLALYALPLGFALSLLGSMIATSHIPGERHDGWGVARGLVSLGSLPACLGYVGLVVLLLHSNTVFSRIRVLAPLGRMALTNYLSQSLICTIYFYGYGLGHWGLSRSGQLVFVAVVYGLQIAFSHWWLARFRYGPMEWLWRGFTYRQVPPLRIDAGAQSAPVGAV